MTGSFWLSVQGVRGVAALLFVIVGVVGHVSRAAAETSAPAVATQESLDSELLEAIATDKSEDVEALLAAGADTHWMDLERQDCRSPCRLR